MLLELRCRTRFGNSSVLSTFQHATGSSKIFLILKLHATDLSLPFLLQGRSQHATEAPLHHTSFLSSASCCQDTASGNILRQSTRVGTRTKMDV